MSPTPRETGCYGTLGDAGAGEPLGILAPGLEGAAGSDAYGLVPLAEPLELALMPGTDESTGAALGAAAVPARGGIAIVSAAPVVRSPALPVMPAESAEEPAAGAEVESLLDGIEVLAEGLPAALMSAAA
jgi:hypothetical protein